MGAFARRYVRALDKPAVKLLVVVFWAAAAGVGAWLIPIFLANTSNDWSGPPDSTGAVAKRELSIHFPSNNTGSFVVYATAVEGSVIGPALASLSFHLQMATNTAGLAKKITLDGYAFAEERGMPEVAQGFVSKDNRSSIVSVTLWGGFDVADATEFLQKVLSEWGGANTLSAEVISDTCVMAVIQSSVGHDMAIADGVTLPLSLALFAWSVSSVRLLICPLACVLCAAPTAFGIMYLVSLGMSVMTATLSLMMSLMIAFCLDYSLFIMSRFMEEVRRMNQFNAPHAVAETLASAGHTVVVSGLTLVAAFLGICIVPENTLRGFSIGGAVGVSVCVAVSVTLLPALLLIFPGFFAGGVCHCTWSRFSQFRAKLDTSQWWLRLGIRSTKFPLNVILILAISGAAVPFGIFAFHFPLSKSAKLALPKGDPFTNIVLSIGDQFGYPNAYTVLVVPSAGTDFLSDAFIDGPGQALLDSFVALPHADCSTLVTFFYANCRKIPGPFLRQCVEEPQSTAQCAQIEQLYIAHVSPTAMTFMVNLPFDPEGPRGEEYYSAAVRLLSSVSTPDLRVFLAGGEGWDGILAAYGYFSLMIVITLALVLLLVGWAFKSIFIPIRAAVTIAITLCFVFGFAVFVYVDGALNWTKFWGFEGQGAILWLPPLVSVTICAGLALDYDMFLLVRVEEFWLDGHDTKDAIVLALSKTGGTITSAGLIMTIAFGGLLFSYTPALNFLGFYLVFSVLIDTFIVRSLLVPSLFSVGVEWNWWPGSRCVKRQAVLKPFDASEGLSVGEETQSDKVGVFEC